MRSPEQSRLSLDRLPVETIRALTYADNLARKQQRTKIGVKQLLQGVYQEMGPVLARSVLLRNGINIEQFTQSLQRLIRNDYVTERDVNADSIFTYTAATAVSYAVERAEAKSTQELLPSDILLGIARVGDNYQI